MITVGGKKYAKNDKEFTDSLFTKQTCSGYYKRMKNGVLLMDMQKEPFGFIKVENSVTVYAVSAHRTAKGVRYMAGLCSSDSERLGLDGIPYIEQSQYLRDAILS